MNTKDKLSLKSWEELRKDIADSTAVVKESATDAAKRKTRLEANPEEWFSYYFPKYCYAKPAKFHIAATKRIINNPTWYECRAWSREMAKDVRTMQEYMYLSLTGKLKCICYFSWSDANASKLLMPIKINLESNHRIINDYGKQKGIHWEDNAFVTTQGVAWYGFGAGTNPQGLRNEQVRPDGMVFSDIDTDEVCRSKRRLDQLWGWIEGTILPMVSVSQNKRITFLNNIIAKDCIMLRAAKKADYFDVVNIRDKKGISNWPEKNSEKQIDWLLGKMSFSAVQKAYFNNPITEGTVFKEMQWGTCPSMKALRFVVVYGDPAPSNKENKDNCYKAVILMGLDKGTLYIYNCRLEHVNNAKFVEWYYDLEQYAGTGTQVYNYLENNTLQDPFYQQVFLPLFQTAGAAHGHYIHVSPDERKKPEKFVRIEGNLEPLNRVGKLIFNISEKNNPHMQRLEEQFKSVDPQLSAPIDGPDAVEGGYYILNSKNKSMEPIILGHRTNNNKNRF